MSEAGGGGAFVVLKLGGSSVSSRARWERIAAVVRERLDEGLRPWVVCSALSGISDGLERALAGTADGSWRDTLAELAARHRELAEALEVESEAELEALFERAGQLLHGASLTEEVSPRLRARVMATGELASTRLGEAFLRKQGLDVAWRDARELLRTGDDAPAGSPRHYLAATPGFEPDEDLQRRAGGGASVQLTQGFIAGDPRGATVLLGRGGSDTSASCLAAKLQARRLEVWTDVPGMFTANPAEIPSARLLTSLDYDEARELATTGAKVLHPRCVEPVRRGGIPLSIRWMDQPSLEGTRVGPRERTPAPQVKAISAKRGITLVSMESLGMWQQAGFLAEAFACFRRQGLSIDLVATSETNVTVSLDAEANALDEDTLQALLDELAPICEATPILGVAMVSLVGRRIRSILHELGPALEVFEEESVHLVSQASSDLNVTFVVDEDQAARTVDDLHGLLFDGARPGGVLGPTWQELSGPPADRAAAPSAWWATRRDDLLDLAATHAPAYVYEPAEVERAADALRGLQPVDRIFYAIKANPHPALLDVVHERGLGFECVSPGELDHVLDRFPDLDRSRILFTPNFAPHNEYARALSEGVHVTVDNLHPLAAWPELFEGRDVLVRLDPGRGRGHHRHVRTAGPQSKFGIAPEQLDRLEELVAAAGARVVGLHAHLGSGVRTPRAWADTGLFLADAAERFPDARILDLGGGLAAGGAAELDLDALGASLADLRAARPGFELWLEPGRFLVAEAGVLLARVTQLKDKGEVHYVGVETGMNTLIRPALYGAHHEIANLTRLGEAPAGEAQVVGPICETGDVLGHARPLPACREGDVLLVARTGAYGRSMSSRYNLREPAAEVVLD